jgi:hypothetical protein
MLVDFFLTYYWGFFSQIKGKLFSSLTLRNDFSEEDVFLKKQKCPARKFLHNDATFYHFLHRTLPRTKKQLAYVGCVTDQMAQCR